MKYFLMFIFGMLWLMPPATCCKNKEVLAFPGAEGAGKLTTGGRGGIVYRVTNLNDDGPGSLRDGIQKKEPRIIVFAVNGYIDLKSRLDINYGDVTIAGQSAPGEGICLRGFGLRINADNVIIRYVRIRPGDAAHTELDALTGMRHKNIIVDHCSLSWATDEVCSLYDNENMSVQWCIISESLNQSYHSKGKHGYGGIWGGMKATFHHNLLAHHTSRNPRLQGARRLSSPQTEHVEIVNNVIYNWQSKCMYAGEQGRYIISANYFKPGPATKASAKYRLLEPYAPYAFFQFSKNILEGNNEVSKDNLKGIQLEKDTISMYFKKSIKSASDYQIESAYHAFERVLKYAGASKVRDKIDKRVIAEVRNGTANGTSHGIIDKPQDAGGWGVMEALDSPEDTDQDGIPNSWEIKNNLNPKDKSDASVYMLDKEYTNIEIYLNSLVSK
ncbi:pectate lyase family protein [Saccharicrinis fermentans]|uniref:Pectate lyase n=1 Tax=Saccharicrinis fermentans DSM 9555 = JCM 21142 TaxID=869213 RepID=W7XYR1_9BACT|nr:hypothetical protein [Saccharicrinis fermentans]GAF03770.1 hypothetical protein JCM21142_62452 [Saccharicrinis fermentans DSM 9555 = JCM 21142]